MMKQLISIPMALGALFFASAHAAPMTIGGVDFDTDNAASTVLWAQGGVFSGLDPNRREACIDPTDTSSTVGVNGVECRALEAAGFDLNESIELDDNDPQTPDGPDVLAAFFDQGPLVNGDGVDLILFETLDQDDSPTVTILLNGQQLLGTKLGVEDVNGDTFTIWGFDFSDLPLGLAMGATVGEPIYVQTFRDGDDADGRVVGSADIAAIVGVNFGEPMPEIPLPAAAWLFIAGLSGLGFAGRRKKKA
ncbi:VPLPA-CTERM sorting domain-containing protein [Hyphococcus flavus]|uniref:VPLPA-CTERM sorting domain-containing protein n=1 Tax=Hyphococcus flavus TaxID=1866326 RepID=A0AAE9ZBI8_9PROT|nr:VPLPA-CTERM sorting domain-containing protein [Hyphococcus flavus]WDI31704.1 VPLPA-CTERM sorting domain-containing protein [Hyphococcus flavus]